MLIETSILRQRVSTSSWFGYSVSPLWLMTFCVYFFNAAWFFISDRLSVNLWSFGKIWLLASMLLFFEAIRRFKQTGSIMPITDNSSGWAIFAEAVLTAPALGTLNHLVMSLNFPLADGALSRWDEWLGFNWYAYADFIGDNHFLKDFTHFTYSLLIVGILFIALIHVWERNYPRCRELFTLHFYSALACILVAAIFPCHGSMEKYGDTALRAKFDEGTGLSHLAQLSALRSNDPVTIDPLQLAGLAEFPSFHTAAAILIVYACRGNVIRMSIAALFSVGMIAGAPIYGWHYIVDLLAGSVVAIIAIVISRFCNRLLPMSLL